LSFKNSTKNYNSIYFICEDYLIISCGGLLKVLKAQITNPIGPRTRLSFNSLAAELRRINQKKKHNGRKRNFYISIYLRRRLQMELLNALTLKRILKIIHMFQALPPFMT